MKHTTSKIQASIVICTYNGEKKLRNCIESLLYQKYPKEKYEIILVDDGSIDRTYAIASSYPIKVIRHNRNLGLANARNTGLRLAKGKVYICFDDDCFADPDWLYELMKLYKKPIAGGCGITRNSTMGIVDKFLYEIGHGNPSQYIDAGKTNPLQRFLIYLKDMYSRTLKAPAQDTYEVNEIWGENCSFPVEILHRVKGWDENLSGVEDTDICKRIKDITDKRFVCTKKAIIYHDGTSSLYEILYKPYIRGYSNLKFYLKNKKIPPLFPFPFITIISTIVSLLLFGLPGIISLLIIPQILYGWWFINYVKTGKNYYLLFCYIQGLQEATRMAGLLNGYIKLQIHNHFKTNKLGI